MAEPLPVSLAAVFNVEPLPGCVTCHEMATFEIGEKWLSFDQKSGPL